MRTKILPSRLPLKTQNAGGKKCGMRPSLRSGLPVFFKLFNPHIRERVLEHLLEDFERDRGHMRTHGCGLLHRQR